MTTPAPILSVSGLSKRFAVRGSRAEVRAVSDVSFDIAKGETFAVVGESGSGKTTVARLVLRLIEPSEGAILFAGADLARLRERDLRPVRRRMQIVFQDPFSSLNPFMTVGEAIAEPLAIHGLARGASAARRVADLLDLVGLPQAAAGRYPHQFSGGQRQRIAIARALAVEPELLVADEAVAALDVSIQAQILNLFADLKERLGLTILFISHDLDVVRHIASRVAVMYGGRIMEIGPASDVIGAPRNPYTRALMSATPSLDPEARADRILLKGDPPSPLETGEGCPFASRCPGSMPRCRSVLPTLAAVGPDHRSACLLHDADGSADEP